MLLLVCFCRCLVGQEEVKGTDVQRGTALLVWHHLHTLGRFWRGACNPPSPVSPCCLGGLNAATWFSETSVSIYCVTLISEAAKFFGVSGGQAQHGPIPLMTSSELPAHVQYRFETLSVGVFGCVLFGWGVFCGFLFVCLGDLGFFFGFSLVVLFFFFGDGGDFFLRIFLIG